MLLPVIWQAYKEIIPAAPADSRDNWYINDHCFIKDINGQWHCFGINNPFPDKRRDLYRYHPFLLHASAPGPTGPWQRQDFALRDDKKGNNYLGAPFVIRHNDSYYMFLETMFKGKRRIEIARSKDLRHWQRDKQEVISNQAPLRRDPCIVRNKQTGDWLIFLCVPDQPYSTITVCRTADFKAYSRPEVILKLKDNCPWGSLESPFVVYKNNTWYLFFTNSMHHYRETVVIPSAKYNRFSWSDQITTLHAHAAEIINEQNQWYISSCGPEDKRRQNYHGVELAALCWVESN
ncbi:MAG TPA: hypothetical protein VKS21_00485 [Spirochaetota bacterium]|nr:hypothetical protein [Spirochaetota bacterium]